MNEDRSTLAIATSSRLALSRVGMITDICGRDAFSLEITLGPPAPQYTRPRDECASREGLVQKPCRIRSRPRRRLRKQTDSCYIGFMPAPGASESAREDRNGRSAHCVVGSGPAGIACARALLQRGARVRLLDAGISLERARADFVAQLRHTAPTSWSEEQMARFKEGTFATAKGIPLKRVYGSDFPYRECDQHLRVNYEGVGVRPSLAKGGLSNVWGAAMMPCREGDIADWPIGLSQLAEHYAAAAVLTGLSARTDDLEQLFPLYLMPLATLDLSRQATMVSNRMEQRRAELARAGVHFGQARVAVQAARPPHSNGCIYCGLCMYGCPYGYIYNSEATLQQLHDNPNFSYQPDIIVTALRESSASVFVEGHNRVSLAPFEEEAERVYLAAGAIATTQILLRFLATIKMCG